jgi:branched-chain amino acid transport system substrate-binding protein
MKAKRLTLIISIVLAAVMLATPFLTSCGTATKTASLASIKIGMMTPSTGPVPEKGIPAQDAIQDCFEYINNELGGADGHPIKVDWQDSAYDMSKVATITQDYMNEGDVLFSTDSASEMKGAQGLANQNGFPGLATFISTMNLHPPLHIYGPTPDYGDDWVAFAKYYMANIWKGTGKPKMALELLQGTVGQGTEDGAKAMADTLGIDLVDIETHALNTTSEITALTRMKALNPDVLFISSVPQATAVIIKNAVDLGMYPNMTIGCASASFTKALVDLAGASVVEGIYGVCHTVSWDDNVPGIAKAKEYCQKNHPADYGNMDYLSEWSTCLIIRDILDEAVKNAGYDVLSKGGADAWKAVEEQGIQKLNNADVQGLQGGTVTYTAGDNRLDKYLRLYQVKNGKITAISNWTVAPLINYPQYDTK